MIATIQRNRPDDVCTSGRLFLDGVFTCYTLEPLEPIPAGSYQVRMSISPRLSVVFKRPFLCPEVLNVPGHTGVRWHPGNRVSDTEDCLLVGKSEGIDWVGYSDLEFAYLMTQLPDEFEVIYRDAPGAPTGTSPAPAV